MKNKFMKIIYDDLKRYSAISNEELDFIWKCLSHLGNYTILDKVFDDSDLDDFGPYLEGSCLSIRSNVGLELLSVGYLGDYVDKVSVNYKDLLKLGCDGENYIEEFVDFRNYIKSNVLVDYDVLPNIDNDGLYEVSYLLPVNGELSYTSHVEELYGLTGDTWQFILDRYLAELFVKMKFYYDGEIDDLKLYNKLLTVRPDR